METPTLGEFLDNGVLNLLRQANKTYGSANVTVAYNKLITEEYEKITRHKRANERAAKAAEQLINFAEQGGWDPFDEDSDDDRDF